MSEFNESDAAIEEFKTTCDAIIIAAEGVRKSIDSGNTVDFVQGTLIITSAVGYLATAGAAIMETSLKEVQEAIHKAGDRMVDDLMQYLKEDKHDDQ